MVGALAVGESEIHGLLEGEDVLRSAAAMRALGAEARRDDNGIWRVIGRGIGALVGSLLTGWSMAGLGPDGLPYSMAAVFMVFVVASVLSTRADLRARAS